MTRPRCQGRALPTSTPLSAQQTKIKHMSFTFFTLLEQVPGLLGGLLLTPDDAP